MIYLFSKLEGADFIQEAGLGNMTCIWKKHEMLTPPPLSHIEMHITILQICLSDLSLLFQLRTQGVCCGYLWWLPGTWKTIPQTQYIVPGNQEYSLYPGNSFLVPRKSSLVPINTPLCKTSNDSQTPTKTSLAHWKHSLAPRKSEKYRDFNSMAMTPLAARGFVCVDD